MKKLRHQDKRLTQSHTDSKRLNLNLNSADPAPVYTPTHKGSSTCLRSLRHKIHIDSCPIAYKFPVTSRTSPWTLLKLYAKFLYICVCPFFWEEESTLIRFSKGYINVKKLCHTLEMFCIFIWVVVTSICIYVQHTKLFT